MSTKTTTQQTIAIRLKGRLERIGKELLACRETAQQTEGIGAADLYLSDAVKAVQVAIRAIEAQQVPRCVLCSGLVEPWPTGDGYGHNP